MRQDSVPARCGREEVLRMGMETNQGEDEVTTVLLKVSTLEAVSGDELTRYVQHLVMGVEETEHDEEAFALLDDAAILTVERAE